MWTYKKFVFRLVNSSVDWGKHTHKMKNYQKGWSIENKTVGVSRCWLIEWTVQTNHNGPLVLNVNLLCSTSIIGNEEQMAAYELHIGVKDYCFGGDDKLIGVSVMQLKDIMDQVIFNQFTILFYTQNKIMYIL